MLYEVIAGPGCLPYYDPDTRRFLEQIVTSPPQPLGEQMPGLDPGLEAIVARMVAPRADRYQSMEVIAVCADYTQPLRLPRPRRPSARTVTFFPGSTIGNFTHDEAERFLGRVAELVGRGGGLLVGIDRKKDPRVIEDAYNDALGVTAAFNLNILRRLNETGADFDLSTFRHHAPYVEAHGRIEMRLISQLKQSVKVGDATIDFEAGEHIVTEHSHKYDLDEFEELAARAGFRLTRSWSDEQDWFSVCFLEVAAD